MRIGEAAQAAGMTSKALRFYEEHGLLPAAKRTANGYRDYTGEAINRLDFIRRGRAAGLALAQIREILILRDAGRAPCTHVRDLLAGQLAGQEVAHMGARRTACVAQNQDFADLCKGQSRGAPATNEVEPVDGFACVIAISVGGALRSRQQPVLFIESQGLARHTRRLGGFTDSHHAPRLPH